MKKSALLSVTILISTFVALGQKNALNKVLIFSKPSPEYIATNKAAIDVFYKTSLVHHSKIDTSSDPKTFTEENLKNFNCIVFLNTSANVLNYPQIVDLQRFMQANGGFVGIHAAAENNYSSIWYKSLIAANVESRVPEKTQFSIITNANLGKTEVSPFWKIEDKPLTTNQLASKCKPILLDVNGKTWAWHYTTDEGGKMFYTAFGGESEVYQNSDFLAHIWAGIEEVSAKELPDFSKVSASALPKEQFFLKQILTQNLNNPTAFTTLPDDNCLISQQDGVIYLYQAENRSLKFLNKIEAIANAQKLKLDPDFTQNGYVYAFLTTTNPTEFLVKRLQLSNDTTATINEFSSTSSAPLLNSAKYNFAQFDAKPYRLPKYFDGKTFRFDEKEGFKIESFDDDGNLKNIEPFLPNLVLKNAKGIDFGTDGALYFLEGNSLIKIDYSEKNRPPVALLRADVTEGKAPLKVRFSAADSYDLDKDMLTFSWQFDDKNISSELEPEFTFTKAGIYNVKLQVTDNQGLSSEKIIQIDVEKGGKTPVKSRKH